MKWLAQLRAWWRGRTDSPPRAFLDPLDYALAYCLYPPPGGLPALAGTWQAAFPVLTAAQAEAVHQQLLALQVLATTLGSRVNQQELVGTAAYQRLWAIYPQLDRRNLGTLLWQACVGTR
ncbi:MAG: hypothetical protein ACRYFX_15220 [Janthinobacterium lividum]